MATASSRVTDLTAILDSMISEFKTEMAYRAANGPKTTYSVGGQNYDWNGYVKAMQEGIREQMKLIQSVAPFTVISKART